MSAPIELVGSTIDSSTSSAVKAQPTVERPPHNDSDMLSHVGVFNAIDPYFYKEYLFKSSFTWNTAQLPGTLLWYAKIHPDECNQGVAYLSKIYNCWTGSIDFKLKIAGTGFHAGSLVLVRLPPNIPPASVTNPADFTMFPYEQVDAKTLECVTRDVMDQRPVLYHYRGDDPSGSTAHGGFYAVYVMLPLATSSTGATAINCNIFSKAGSSFRVAQPRPLSIVTTSPQDVVGYGSIFPQAMTGIINNSQILSMQINTTNTSTSNDMYGLVGVDGTLYSNEPNWTPPSPCAPNTVFLEMLNGATSGRAAYKGCMASGIPFVATNRRDLPYKVPTGTVRPANVTGDPTFMQGNQTYVGILARPNNAYLKLYRTNAADGGQDVTLSVAVTNNTVGRLTFNFAYPYVTQLTATDTDQTFPPPVVVPTTNEVLVMFIDSANLFNIITTQGHIAFRGKTLFEFEPDQCIIFCYYDNLGRPIRYFKLLRGGYLTTTTPPANLNLSLDPFTGGAMKVIGLGLAADPLPTQVGLTTFNAALGNERSLVQMKTMEAQMAKLTLALGI